MRVLRPAEGAAPFESEPLDTGMFCLFRTQAGADGITLRACPIRLGKVLRVASEVGEAFAIIEPYWPLLRPEKYQDKVNLFGTWTLGNEPVVDGERMPKRRRVEQMPALMIDLADVLVWPIDVEQSERENPPGVRIPLLAFYRLRHHGVDLATSEFTFAKRGKAFFLGVCKGIAEQLYESALSEETGDIGIPQLSVVIHN